ncbi:hypothetical protein ABFS82_08G122200 [Erythranthe guttata]|uniref:NPH3 domain-containing protein n=1 Tax=Erythranthe guttata TaxID=4155 RepID=A0A022RT00_ERYGU|nr:hypothetical protein MIMGU_mgv1a024231mg [Erythranthe guttata]
MRRSSLLSSPNVGALLQIKILSWSQETGSPVCIRVRIADRTFNLHKYPLTRKSGYLKEKLKESNEVELPPDFPGGPETFETIALFIYGSSTLVDPFNVSSLRCAAQFLDMTEEYMPGNLCDRFDVYLNQVVLQSWNDTLIVLQSCQTLLPWSEDVLIVSRCIETLAFMACMEILDPERRRDHPVITLESLSCMPNWSDQTVIKEIISRDLWIKDLIALPFSFFKRVIGSLRRQGMKERYVSPIILFYAHKYLISRNNRSHEGTFDDSLRNVTSVKLQGVIDLLPVASKVIPIGFYFSLLSTSVDLCLKNECVAKLQNQIVSVLHLARVQDFILPNDEDGTKLSIMETIFSTYLSCNNNNNNLDSDSTPTIRNNFVVAQLWDEYLNQIAINSDLSCKRFINLIETVPISVRQTHDHLYRALNTFFQSHPNLSQEEKGLVCKHLNCQKLSQHVCIEAVQNKMMPLRLIVQALFVQQLNTQKDLKECSDSFRYTNGGECSGSLSSSIYANSQSQNIGDSPYMNGSEGGSRPLSFFMNKDSSMLIRPHDQLIMSSDISMKDYESASFRIQTLEKEVLSLKRRLQSQKKSNKNDKSSWKKIEPVSGNIRAHSVEERRLSKKKNGGGQVSTSCIGTANFASQRKYVNRLLKVLQRISLFGRGRSSKRD